MKRRTVLKASLATIAGAVALNEVLYLRPSIQDLIDAAPDYSTVNLPSGVSFIDAPMNFAGRTGLRVVGHNTVIEMPEGVRSIGPIDKGSEILIKNITFIRT